MMSPDLNRPALGLPESRETSAPATRKAKIVWITIFSLVVALLAGLIVPGFIRVRRQSHQKACQENIEMLDDVKQQWALENKKRPEDIPTWDDLLRDGYISEIPICPSVGHAGSYALMKVTQDSECVSGLGGHTTGDVCGGGITDEEWEAMLESWARECAPKIALIDQAVADWARDKKKSPGASVTFKELVKGGYLTHRPRCPGWGSYEISKVDSPAVCSVHSIPKENLTQSHNDTKRE